MPGRRVFPILALAASLAQAGCLAVENRLLYHPMPDAGEELPPDAPLRNVWLPTAHGTVHARWCPHPAGRGAVLYCHGNAGNLGMRGGEVHRLWEALGEAVLIVDYPGYGRSEGTPTEAGCYAAAEAAYDWLCREQGIPPERIVIYGESLGGAVAAELASRRPHRALVLVRTFTSFPDVAQAQVPWLPVRDLVHNRFDNLEKLRDCRSPVLIAQAQEDRLVPFDHGPRLLAACTAPKRFFVLEGLGHNDPPGRHFYSALRNFLERGNDGSFVSKADCFHDMKYNRPGPGPGREYDRCEGEMR